MKRNLLQFCLGLTFITGTASNAALPEIHQLSDLQRLDQSEIDALYESLEAGAVPNGSSTGKAIVLPGTIFTYPAAQAMGLIWQGKIFETNTENHGGVLFNRVFGFKAIKAKVFLGESWFDGNESIIVDYRDTSLLVPLIRDEIREISEGLYLGRAYARTVWGPQFILNFALDFRH